MKIFLLPYFFFLSSTLLAQYNWDFGGGIGAANYRGDFGLYETNPISTELLTGPRMKLTAPAAQINARCKLLEKLYLNSGISYSRIQSADSLSVNIKRRGRNLHFRNDIPEISSRAEFNFYNNYDFGGHGRYILGLNAYVFAGIGAFYNNPKAKNREGKWVALRPLATEGNKYSFIQYSLPVGIGFYYTFKRKHRIEWEFNWRFTNTDYLDDVSGQVPDRSDLSEEALNTGYRSDEITERPKGMPSAKVYNKAGQPRGNSKKYDKYFTSLVSYKYVMKGKYKNAKFNATKSTRSGRFKTSKRRKSRAKF